VTGLRFQEFLMASSASVPGPRAKPIIGHLTMFRRDPLGFLFDSARSYGDVVHLKFGPQDVFLINHPDHIRDILVTNNRNFVKSRGLEMAKKFLGEGLLTSEGEFHRRQRRLTQPAFHRQRINSYADRMIDYADQTRNRWTASETLDISQEMMRLTLSIVGKTLFDAEVEGEAGEIGKALTDVMQLFERITTPFAGLLEKLPLPSNMRWLKAKQRLDSTIYRIINERRASGEDRGDLRCCY
jgi:cytochrome P450